MKVLLVEDDENKRLRLLGVLQSITSGVDCAASYQSALRALLQTGYDAIVLDMTLPTFDISEEDDGLLAATKMETKILIVEDDTAKLQNVSASLCAIPGISLPSITECRDATSAKNHLLTEQFDLLILDTRFPPGSTLLLHKMGG